MQNIFIERGHNIMIENTNRLVIGEFPIPTNKYHGLMEEAYKKLYAGTGAGAEMRDWLWWPKKYLGSDEYKRLLRTASRIYKNNEAVVVIGIGGSYLTPKMIIHSEYGEFYNEFSRTKIYFVGCDLSPNRLEDIRSMLYGIDFSIIYISKSGGTMEPALAFRVFWEDLCKRYGKEANKRVYAITDSEKGILKSLADEHGWESFVIPDGIGGRYSGLTSCGLLPLVVAGINTDELLKGAIQAMEDCEINPDNFARKYAEWRYYNYAELGNRVEFFATNSPDLSYTGEWLKQLFGESEGKDGKGIFPASGVFPTDLHSLGQFLQDGTRNLIFETFIMRDFIIDDLTIPESYLKDNLENRAGKNFAQAAAAAMDGAYKAHAKGGNPCGKILVKESIKAMGALMYYMFVACATYCYMLDVNPFNQPGVEAHKANMKVSPEWDK